MLSACQAVNGRAVWRVCTAVTQREHAPLTNAGMGKSDIVSVIPEVPITELRPPPPVDKLHDVFYDAGQPRANRAPTLEKPKGTEDR